MANEQLRIYQLQPDMLEEFHDFWRNKLIPARREFGFEVVSGWHEPERNEFIWIVRWPGEGTFEEAVARYAEWPGKPPLPDPVDKYVGGFEERMLEPVSAVPGD